MKKLELDIKANDREWLYIEYINKQRSIRSISRECLVSDDTIKTRLRKFKIEIRDRGEANKLGYTRVKHKETNLSRAKIERQKTGKIIKCQQCKNDFYINKKSTKKFCSKICSLLYKKEHINRNQFWRDFPEYSKWRDLVYFRDFWKCKICGSKEKINAHHIFEGVQFSEKRFLTENGITLCQKHHIQVHKYQSSFIQECIKQTSNIGGTPEVDNPEASIKEYLSSLIRSNDYQEVSRTDNGIVWSATITEEIAEMPRNEVSQ